MVTHDSLASTDNEQTIEHSSSYELDRYSPLSTDEFNDDHRDQDTCIHSQ